MRKPDPQCSAVVRAGTPGLPKPLILLGPGLPSGPGLAWPADCHVHACIAQQGLGFLLASLSSKRMQCPCSPLVPYCYNCKHHGVSHGCPCVGVPVWVFAVTV